MILSFQMPITLVLKSKTKFKYTLYLFHNLDKNLQENRINTNKEV